MSEGSQELTLFKRLADAATREKPGVLVRIENFKKSSLATPVMKPATSLPPISLEEPSDLGLPEVSEASVRLMESRPPPSFAEQIAHAKMLLAWKTGEADGHPPRQHARFEM